MSGGYQHAGGFGSEQGSWPSSSSACSGRSGRTDPDRIVVAVVPALDESAAIADVVRGLYEQGVTKVVVANNGSSDGTAEVARAAGADVVDEPVRGYGRACLAGLATVARYRPDVVVFADGDGSDVLEDLPSLLEPVLSGRLEMVIGSRLASAQGAGVLPVHVRAGNRLATTLLRLLFGARYSDLGPLRVIDYAALCRLGMRDQAFGWTAEMQARAAMCGLSTGEVPVRYRARRGRSKISGTVVGSIRAGIGIIGIIVKLASIRLLGRR